MPQCLAAASAVVFLFCGFAFGKSFVSRVWPFAFFTMARSPFVFDGGSITLIWWPCFWILVSFILFHFLRSGWLCAFLRAVRWFIAIVERRVSMWWWR